MSAKSDDLTPAKALAKFRGPDWITPLILAAVGGIFTYQLTRPSGLPSCEGQTMGPGDACIVFRGGSSYTYEERMAEYAHADAMNAQYWPFVAIALLVLIAWVIYRGTIEPRLVRIEPVAEGTDESGHFGSAAARGIGAVGGFIALYLAYSFWQSTLHEPSTTGWVLTAGAAAGGVVLLLLTVMRRDYVRVTPDTLLVALGTRVRTVAWSQATVFEHPKYSLRVEGPGGPVKVQHRTVTGADTLWTRARAFLLQAQLMPAVERLSAGETLEFGPIRATPDGVGTAERLIPWGQVATIAADDSFTINGSDGTSVTVPVLEVANRWVLEQIVEVIVRGLREQG